MFSFDLEIVDPAPFLTKAFVAEIESIQDEKGWFGERWRYSWEVNTVPFFPVKLAEDFHGQFQAETDSGQLWVNLLWYLPLGFQRSELGFSSRFDASIWLNLLCVCAVARMQAIETIVDFDYRLGPTIVLSPEGDRTTSKTIWERLPVDIDRSQPLPQFEDGLI